MTNQPAHNQPVPPWQSVLENLPIIVAVLDRDGKLTFLRRPDPDAALSPVLGAHVLDYVSPDHHATVTEAMRSVFEHGASGVFEARVCGADNSRCWYRICFGPFRPNNEDVGMLMLCHDISDEKETERALRESEQHHRALNDTLNAVLFRTDPAGALTYVSPSIERLTGRPPAHFLGLAFLEWVHPDDHDAVNASFRRLAGGAHEVMEFRTVSAAGDTLWIRATSRSVTENGLIVGFQGIAADITERRRAEEQLHQSREQLRALAGRMESVREEERTRISREIHDELGHNLTALKMEIAQLRKRITGAAGAGLLASRAAFAGMLEGMSSQLDRTIQSVRRIATELRPGVLDHLGISAAIEWLAQDFEKRTQIACRLILPEKEIPLDPNLSTGLFRIAQEILTNIAKHSKASEVTIGLEEKDGLVTLAAHDNGRGLSRKNLFDTQSLGILGMEERARLLGGDLEIRGGKDQGTTVIVRIPLVPSPSEQKS